MKNIEDSIVDAKNAIPDVTPTPSGMKAQSSGQDLKSRLEWGEPALTIIDVRDRLVYNQGHILGAMDMPLDSLAERATASLQPTRDIYVYGETDEESAVAAQKLREAGFQSVSELKGGFAGWKAIAGPTEGTAEAVTPPGSEGYNVVSQVANHAETQQNNR